MEKGIDGAEPSTVDALVSWLDKQGPELELSALTGWLAQQSEAHKRLRALAVSPPDVSDIEAFDRWIDRIEIAIAALPETASVTIHPDLPGRLHDRLRQECQQFLEAEQKADYLSAIVQVPVVVRLLGILRRLQIAGGASRRTESHPISSRIGAELQQAELRTVDGLLAWLARQSPEQLERELLCRLTNQAGQQIYFQILDSPPPDTLTEEWMNKVVAALSGLRRGMTIKVAPDLVTRLQDELRGACEALLAARQASDYQRALAQVPRTTQLCDVVQRLEHVAPPEVVKRRLIGLRGSQERTASPPQSVPELLSRLAGKPREQAAGNLATWLLAEAEERKALEVLTSASPEILSRESLLQWLSKVESALSCVGSKAPVKIHDGLTGSLQDKLRQNCAELFTALQTGNQQRALEQIPVLTRLHAVAWRIERLEEQLAVGSKGIVQPKKVAEKRITDPNDAEGLFHWLADQSPNETSVRISDWLLRKLEDARRLGIFTILPSRITDEWLAGVEAALADLPPGSVVKVHPEMLGRAQSNMQEVCKSLLLACARRDHATALKQAPAVVRRYDLVRRLEDSGSETPQLRRAVALQGCEESGVIRPDDVARLQSCLEGRRPEAALAALSDWLLQEAITDKSLGVLEGVPSELPGDIDEWISRIEGTVSVLPLAARAAVPVELAEKLKGWKERALQELDETSQHKDVDEDAATAKAYSIGQLCALIRRLETIIESGASERWDRA